MRILRVGAAIGASIALALTACGGPGSPSPANPAGDGSVPAAANDLKGILQGTGASSAKAAQDVWRAAFQTANPGVTVNYSPDGSGAGRTAFAEGAAAFAVSDRALATGELGGVFALCADGTRPLSLPVYVSPIGIVYNVAGVAELNLTARVIAMIFTGRITRWNDPAIAGLNPGIALPELAITPVHRSDNSGTTENFTQTLAQAAPEVWTSEPSGDWPADLGGEGGDKTQGVVLAVQQGSGMIGYADISGVPVDMKMARYSRDGGDYVTASAEAAAAVVSAARKADGRVAHDWALDLDRTVTGYPFVLVSYAIACQEYRNAATGRLVGAYLSYVVSADGQQAAQPQTGNAPLSGVLAAGVQEAAGAIR